MIASLAIPSAVVAQDQPIKLESGVQLVRPAADGAEPVLVAPEGVLPGDTLVFTTSYRNEGRETVEDFVIVNPVSPDLLLTDEAASLTEVSVDGGQTWGRLAGLSVVGEDGEERPANAGDITHMRWTFDEVSPAGAGEVRFSATVR